LSRRETRTRSKRRGGTIDAANIETENIFAEHLSVFVIRPILFR